MAFRIAIAHLTLTTHFLALLFETAKVSWHTEDNLDLPHGICRHQDSL
jgi:hypothetical protein